MKRLLTLAAVLGALALGPGLAQAQIGVELLTNGSLDVPGLHEEDLATGWTLTEGPGEVNAATFATFANNTPEPPPPGSTAQVGLWYRAFEGTTFDNPRDPVFAHLTQAVPGVPGLPYVMSGWARFEANYAGGMEFLPSGGSIDPPAPGRWPEDTPSPTRSEFALEFLDAGNNVLPGSVVVDLFRDLGQTNDNQWHQHTLSAVAPAGTVLVQVRSSMIDGVNSDLNPQSAFVDDFSLIAIPEPASLALGMLGLLALAGLARRRR